MKTTYTVVEPLVDEAAALDRAEAGCRARGASLTPIRRMVLAILLRNPGGLKAYDLLERIKADKPGASPPTVYRALDFLIEQGLAHKIGRMNLFVACSQHCHQPQMAALFLVCPRCNGVTELQDDAVIRALSASLVAAGHQLESQEVEIGAICPRCRALAQG